MQFGIKTAPEHTTWDDMLAVWRAADEIDLFESAWNFDHFYPIMSDPSGPCMESWVTLTALAALTSRIRVGCMVNGVPYRHPALIANMAASLDIVSGGRLELGLGAGWNDMEASAYGIDLYFPLKRRLDRFDEAVEVIVSLLTQEHTDFDGEYFKMTKARCEPKGPQRPHPPIVIGGTGEKRILRSVARWAQHWNMPFASPDTFKQKKEVLLRHCADIGRDPTEITCSLQIALAADGDVSEAAAGAAMLKEAGVDLVIFTLLPPHRASIIEPLARALADIA